MWVCASLSCTFNWSSYWATTASGSAMRNYFINLPNTTLCPSMHCLSWGNYKNRCKYVFFSLVETSSGGFTFFVLVSFKIDYSWVCLFWLTLVFIASKKWLVIEFVFNSFSSSASFCFLVLIYSSLSLPLVLIISFFICLSSLQIFLDRLFLVSNFLVKRFIFCILFFSSLELTHFLFWFIFDSSSYVKFSGVFFPKHILNWRI